MNSRLGGWKKAGVTVGRGVSRMRSFKRLSDDKIHELSRNNLKKRTEAKMFWGVRAYREWRLARLNDVVDFDVKIFEANLDTLATLTKENFEYTMCRFIPEVTKLNGSGDYPDKSLYQLCVTIQIFLNQNGIPWMVVEGSDFCQLRSVLDNVMKQRANANLGTVAHQASVISYDLENEMWSKGVLGEDSPDKL